MEKRLKKENIKKFIFAGKSTVTVENLLTTNYFTYKVIRAKGEKENRPWFVNVLTGSDNEKSYTYIGSVFPKDMSFTLTKGSKFSDNAQSVKVAKFIFNMIKTDNYKEVIAFYHDGKCGSCGRKLTTPESIERGLGPVCGDNIISKGRERRKKIAKALNS